MVSTPRTQLVLYPTGPGEPAVLAEGALDYPAASFLPDNRRLLSVETGTDRNRRFWLIETSTHARTLISPEQAPAGAARVSIHIRHAVSNDGRWVLGKRELAGYFLFPLEGTPVRKWEDLRPVPGLGESDYPVGWTSDDRAVYVRQFSGATSRIYRLTLANGERTLWRTIAPIDPVGALAGALVMTPDARVYAYSYNRSLSTLYIVDGLR